ncbi:calcium-independent phospholipase A2-gamma isoform X2 [Orussus abietinus]|nr:calcium-independent phospholipase A2-gamma isoform X2 [Orussus abietinus]XP_023288723.1 calcium-independent phospholipase A2-gamma isoform X2 [Orussus abietinus]
MSSPMNGMQGVKMSMQNQWKFLTQLRDYLNKFGYDKNLQFVASKEWVEFLQKVAYTQVDGIRKFSLANVIKSKEQSIAQDSVALKQRKEEVQNIIETSKVLEPEEAKQEAFVEENVPVARPITKEQSYTLPQVLSDLIPKLNIKSKATLSSTPKWKSNIHSTISKHSIASRTRHVLNSIKTAESNASKWRRIEDLLLHIEQYPEARHHAIKEGAISILLRIRQTTKEEQIKGSIREALTILGHVDPLPGQGIRILSIDGGGVRGVLVVEMLKKIETLTGKRIYECFDYICGVSTGAILSAILGGDKRKTLDELSELYKEIGTKIFTQSPIRGTSSLVWSHAYYDTALWEELLKEQLGDKDLIKTARDSNSPKFSVISTVVNHARVMAYVFRNYTLPHGIESQYMGSYRHKLWEAVRASAAAPSYFEEYKNGEFLHQDGGIIVNNPCAVAIHEAKQLWPNNPIQCVVSFGTGRAPSNISGTDEIVKEVPVLSSWKEKFFKILDSATDTEAVHTMLNDLLPDHVYFRFNPYLTEMLTMVEIRPEKIKQLEQDARMYIRRNEEKFQDAAKSLLKERTLLQKAADWANLQKQIFNL